MFGVGYFHKKIPSFVLLSIFDEDDPLRAPVPSFEVATDSPFIQAPPPPFKTEPPLLEAFTTSGTKRPQLTTPAFKVTTSTTTSTTIFTTRSTSVPIFTTRPNSIPTFTTIFTTTPTITKIFTTRTSSTTIYTTRTTTYPFTTTSDFRNFDSGENKFRPPRTTSSARFRPLTTTRSTTTLYTTKWTTTTTPRPTFSRPAIQLTPDFENECLLRTCTQTLTGRDLNYGRILDIIQNEEYLSVISMAEVDFVRNRAPRSIVETITQNVSSLYQPNELAKVGLIGILAGLALFNFADSTPERNPKQIQFQSTTFRPTPVRLTKQIPSQFPQPGTEGGGRVPIGNNQIVQTALSLVPPGLEPLAVFPPYAQLHQRKYPAISVIFAERRPRRKRHRR